MADLNDKQITTPDEYRGIKPISPRTAEVLIAHIDVHGNSPYQVIELNGQLYNVTEAKTEHVLDFIKRHATAKDLATPDKTSGL